MHSMFQNTRQMAQGALQCGESADLINSIQSASGRIPYDALAKSCQMRTDISGQLSAFNPMLQGVCMRHACLCLRS